MGILIAVRFRPGHQPTLLRSFGWRAASKLYRTKQRRLSCVASAKRDLRCFGWQAIRGILIRISDNAFPESTVSRSRRMFSARFVINGTP
jgi:hypothetical protein